MTLKKEDLKYVLSRHYKNYWSWKQDVLRQAGEIKEPPAQWGVLYFCVTNLCNAKCVFCAYRKTTDQKGFMSMDVYEAALKEWVAMGLKKISFTPTVGDPLLDSQLFQKIALAQEYGIRDIYFYTNGIMLKHNENYKRILDANIPKMMVSLPETDREGYKRVYGVDAYDIFIEGLELLLAENKRRGGPMDITLNFRASVYPSQVRNSPDFKRVIEPYLNYRVRVAFMVDYDNWGGDIGKNDLQGVMKMRRIPKVKNIPCMRTYDVAILHNGLVRLCACRLSGGTEVDGLVIGDITKKPLREILTSPEVQRVRDSFRKKELLSVCRSCSLYETRREEE